MPPRSTLKVCIDGLEQGLRPRSPASVRGGHTRAQREPTRRRSNRFRSAGDHGYAAGEWLGSTSRFQKGLDTLPESPAPEPLNPFRAGL